MKYAIKFSVIALVVILMAASGCYKYGQEEDVKMYDIFEDSEDETSEESEGIEETGEEEKESALAKLLKKRAQEKETEEVEPIEEEQEETIIVEQEEEPEEKETKSDSSIPQKDVKEGDLVDFSNLKATDADGDKITYSFSEPLDKKGKWQTEEGDEGEYIVTITASDGKSEVSQKIMIVVEGLNKKPTIKIDDITVEEGETVELNPVVNDADDDPLTVEYTGWMESDTYETTYNDAGVYTVIIKVSDGKVTVLKDVVVTVENKNRAPILKKIDDVEIVEGETLSLKSKASDADSDLITYKYTEPLDENGEWQTDEGDAGEYTVTVTASDGELKDSQEVVIIVVTANEAPSLSIDDVLVNVGDTVGLDPVVSDPEGDDVEVTYSGWMTSDTKVADEAGEFEVTVTASDGEKETSKTITVSVNTPPEFDLSGLL